MYGILPKSYQLILDTLAEFNEVEQAFIYGSRATGTHKKGSDIDLAIMGEKITENLLLKIKVKLEHELPIPYFFDLTHFERISNPALKEHIENYGKLIYQSAKKQSV